MISNAPRTTLFSDEIFIGSAGQRISMEPGLHILTISAEGYDSIEKKIKVEIGKTTKIKVALAKTGEAARAAARKKSDALAAASKKKPSKSKNEIADADDFVSKKPKRAINFNQDFPQEKKSGQQKKI